MKTLAQILEASAQVRAEQQESKNTAERVGGVLCDLTDFLKNKTALTGVNVRTDANGVTIEVRAQTGDGQEASTALVFPKASETQAGIITAELLQTLRAGINSNSDTIQNLDTVLQDCVSKITAAQASIKGNSDNIKDLLAASNLHDTRLANHGKAIEYNQARISEHRTEIDAAKTAISAAQESIQGNANEIASAKAEISAAKADIQYQSSRIDTLHRASEKQDLSIEKNHNDIKEVKTKLDEYPSQFVLDLGTVSSQEEGESRAASSEVAGNRNISFIRFQTQGVNNLKTILILQYPNGENYTAQIKFVDKAQWRRNVTGATGVKGAATTATQWERTAPHYLGYDAANRKIQFKDYTQTVSRDVQLPLVSASSAGLMSAEDKAALESAKKEVPELRYRLQGREDMSENCSAYTDPFISLGEFSGWDVFSSKLKNGDLMGKKYMGRCRARVNGVTVEMYQFINSFSQNNYTQVILGNVSAAENGDVKFTPDNFNIIHRQYKDGVWAAWQRINSHPLATPSSDGFMSAQDKAKLENYPSQFVLDLGTVSSQEEGESRAASSDVAGNRNISFIRFQVNGVSALKTTLILQWPNGINETGQIKFIDKAQWRRNVSGATGVSGATTTATQWERTAPHYIGYDAARRMIQLKDYTQTVSREVELPLATSTQHGLMSEVDKKKIDNYPNNPLNIPLATLSKPGLMGATDCRTLAETNMQATQNKNDIATLQSTAEQQGQRISTLESFHAPSDYVEMTIRNDQTQRNVLFYKIEWIDDLEIDGRPINTEGLSGKFYRSLSVGEHKVRFRVSEENRTQRGLLGWADDESAGYLSHVTRIVIPEGWTELPSNCFERRVHLEEVVLPSTLRIVGGNCFQSLPALRELIIPQSVTTINWSAINDCASLKSIRMGGSESMPLSLASEAIRNCPALTCVEFLPCRLTFKGSTSPFQNLPQLSALICHLTEEPTFEPASPFGSIGSSASNKKLYRPAGIAFYASGYWRTQLCNSLGFTPADI